MKITTPLISNFNKDRLAPSNEKLASFTVGQLPKNIMKPFMFISTSKLNLSYKKLRDRYEYLRQLEPSTSCDPKCQEGWYWDCETETCKEFDFRPSITSEVITVLIISKYYLWESLPVGNGTNVKYIGEGWAYSDFDGNTFEVITKTVSITESCGLSGCTQYKPANTPNPFKTVQQLADEHMEDFKTVTASYFADMKLYGLPNAIIDDYSSVEFHANGPYEDGDVTYSSGPIKMCYKYSFANLPAKYIGQERELAISILRSKYGFRI